ncbi:MAG: hypothetical protein ACYSW4_04120 [Planctomycetota bacterium]|jgi:hypothetical protein
MRKNFRNSSNESNGLLGQLAAEKKKTVIALCLIGVMVLMWTRVLGKKTPGSAEATLIQTELSQDTPESKMSFIELPKVEGRNDILTRDFFASNGWQNFIGDREGNIEKVNVVSVDGSEEVARRIAERLKLRAIGLGKKPQVFINDELLSMGDKLLVSDGVNTYECEVTGIEENAVFLRCGEAEIKLGLTQVVENSR